MKIMHNKFSNLSLYRRVAVAQNNEDDDEDTTDGEGDARYVCCNLHRCNEVAS